MKTLPINLPINEINLFCQKNNIKKLSLFGSVLRDDFSIQSDVDILVEFSKVPNFFDLVDMEDELSNMLGREVDLRTPAELSPYFCDRVLGEAMVIYGGN